MAFRNIIFDIDGTMVDSYRASYQSVEKALQEYTGKKFDSGIINKHYGIPRESFLELIGIEHTEELNDLIDKYYDDYIKTIPLFEGIENVIKQLSKKDLNLSIVTSRTQEEYNEFQNNTISNYFKGYVISEDTIEHKPNPEPLLKIIKDLKLDKKETIYIGDTKYDSECAKNVGIKFGLALWGTLDNSIDADYYFKKPEDIIKMLEI